MNAIFRHMKKYSGFICAMFLFACHGNKQVNSTGNDTKKVLNIAPVTGKQTAPANQKDSSDTQEDEILPYYIVVVDTGTDYYKLHDRMVAINKSLKIPVDTLGRYYNKTKNLIALPDNDSDEIYAGNYYPRRAVSESLSLEYLNFYHLSSGEKTIVLLSGIYEKKNSADSALTIVKTQAHSAFVMKAEIYQGCMH